MVDKELELEIIWIDELPLPEELYQEMKERLAKNPDAKFLSTSWTRGE